MMFSVEAYMFPVTRRIALITMPVALEIRCDTKLRSTDLTDFLNQRVRDYCIGMISSRWWAEGANVCGAGGRYPSAECGLTVL